MRNIHEAADHGDRDRSIHRRSSACDDLESPKWRSPTSDPYVCAVCGKRLTTARNLKNHSFKHTGGHPFACIICGQQFALIHSMRKHMLNIHKAADDGDRDAAAEWRTQSSSREGSSRDD